MKKLLSTENRISGAGLFLLAALIVLFTGCEDGEVIGDNVLNINASPITIAVTEEAVNGTVLNLSLSADGTGTAALSGSGDILLNTVDSFVTATPSLNVSMSGKSVVTVYVYGAADADAVNDTGEVISITYPGAANSPVSVNVTINDDDAPANPNLVVSTSTINVTEGAASGQTVSVSFDIAWAGNASLSATGDVLLNTVDNAGTALGSIASLGLNGTSPVTVYVFGGEDADGTDDNGESITVTYAGADNSPVSVVVNIADDDIVFGLNLVSNPGVLTVNEGGGIGVELEISLDGAGTGDASLSASGDVLFNTVDNAAGAVSSIGSLALNGTNPATVYVFAASDSDFLDDSETISINYAGVDNSPLNVSVAVTDDDNADNTTLADLLLSNPAVRKGLVVHIGCSDGGLTLALYMDDEGRHTIQGYTDNASDLDTARLAIEGAGKYGTQCSVFLCGFDVPLPYHKDMVNTVVVDNFPAKESAGITVAEILEILAPYGSAFLVGGPTTVPGATVEVLSGGWVRVAKGYPGEMAEWRQSGYDASIAKISPDQMAGPVSSARWISGARWTDDNGWGGLEIVSAGGRTYYKYEILTAESYGYGDVEPGWRIIARDAFNGLDLWENIIPWPTDPPYAVTGRLCAVGDILHVNGEAWDGKTGQVIGSSPFNSASWIYADEPGLDPMWIKIQGSAIVVDYTSGTELYKRASGGGYKGCVGEGKLFQRLYSTEIMCLNLDTFTEEWVVDCTGDPQYIFYRDGTIFLRQDTDPCRVVAYSASDGTRLWEYSFPQAYHGGESSLFFLNGLCWIHAADDAILYPGHGETYRGLNPVTGVVDSVVYMDSKVKHRCTDPRATEKYIMSGGMNFLDVDTEQMYGTYGVRNACSFGFLPANGLLYNGPTVCECFGHLRGNIAGASVTVDSWVAMRGRSDVDHVQGPAWGSSGSVVPGAGDWPTYRLDMQRSGVTDITLSETLAESWNVPVGGSVTPPVVAGGYVFAADIPGHRVVCLNISDGSEVWDYTVGGPVDTPPTLANGYAVFGCRNGWVYCLNSETGGLVWKFRAAPEERRMQCRREIESVWPVHGSVLVMSGKVYFSAGRQDEVDGGIFLFCLDLATGAKQWENQIQRPNLLKQDGNALIDNEQNDILSSDGSTIIMYRKYFNVSDGLRTTVLTSDYLHGGRAGWLYDLAKRPYTWKHDFQASRKCIRADSGGTRFAGGIINYDFVNRYGVVLVNDYKLIRYKYGSTTQWEVSIPAGSCPKSLAVTASKFFVPGLADELDKNSGELKAYARADGSLLNTIALPYAPGFDSVAAVPGKLVVSLQNGSIVCLSE